MKYNKIRDKFLNFFNEKNHKIIGESSLVPESDPTVLLTNSGMLPLKPYFLGLEKPPSNRLVNIQRCFRTGDIDDVGSNSRTLTFFFMLGSWSIGDYFKKEAIDLAWELVTKHFKLDKDRIWVSVFKGDKLVPWDKESYKAWQKYLPRKRIVKLGKDNFWIAGTTGPCGPSTEIYYDRGEKFGCKKKSCKPGCDCDRFFEIWNAGVFMEYNKDEKGKLSELPMKSVDTGAGLERFAALLQGKNSIFEIDMFKPIVDKIISLSEKRNTRSIRIIADHIRGSVFLIMDNVMPSNLDRGYILRRILRRAILHSKLLGIKEKISILAEEVIDLYKYDYPLLHDKWKNILKVIDEEDEKFSKSLSKGMRMLDRIIKETKIKKLKTKDVFKLYASYGFPIELTKEIAEENKLSVDEKAFWKLFKEHQEVSRAGVEKKLGGVGHFGVSVARQHTTTHLLHQALRDVLGKKIEQAGSDLTPERIRFDFTFDRALTSEEIKKVEEIVNSKIKEGLVIRVEEMDFDKAKKVAIGLFEEKYKDRVKVYSIGSYSREICAGPHVKNTREIGKFKIVRQKSIGKGLRRIRAVVT